MKRTREAWPSEVKANVIAEWMAGASLDGLAVSHRAPKSTVQRWVKGLVRTVSIPKPNALPDKETIDDLAWDWTKAQSGASLAILRKAQDDSWLSRQNAHDLGVFYGIIADKQLRLLAAFRPAEPKPTTEHALVPVSPGDRGV